MSQRGGFTAGFLAGAIVGGVVGGLVGTLVSSRRANKTTQQQDKSFFKSDMEANLNPEESMEIARRALDEKIAQLNLAIDNVRQQLGSVNGNSLEKE
jgi:gas vesicle protein